MQMSSATGRTAVPFGTDGRPLPYFSAIHRMPEISFGNRAATLFSELRKKSRDQNTGLGPGRAVRFALKAARLAPLRPSTGCPQFPLEIGARPFESRRSEPTEERFGFCTLALAACVPRCAASAVTKTRGGENHSPDGFPSPFESLPNDDKQNGYRMVPVLFGGGGEIRTLERLMTVTRFPVVRPRPN